MASKLERRVITTEFRAVKEDGKPTTLRGYAAVFNSDSEDLGGFTEQIAPGAFTEVLSATPDCRCLVNHDPSALLGRTKSGTLTLRQDSTGLFYEVSVPDTQLGRDLLVLAERGDISQSSFGFTVADEAWFDASGAPSNSRTGVKRVIRKVGALLDVSPVTYPAYPESSVEARSRFFFPEGAPERRAVEPVVAQGADSMEQDIADVQEALDEKYPLSNGYEYYGCQYWIFETYPDKVIAVEYVTGKYFVIPYTEDEANETYTFGEPAEVETVWVPVSERAKQQDALYRKSKQGWDKKSATIASNQARTASLREIAKRRLALKIKK